MCKRDVAEMQCSFGQHLSVFLRYVRDVVEMCLNCDLYVYNVTELGTSHPQSVHYYRQKKDCVNGYIQILFFYDVYILM